MVWTGAKERNPGPVFPGRTECFPAPRYCRRLCGHVGTFPTQPGTVGPNCRIVSDKFHVMQHANAAVDEVRRAEFFRKGGRQRGLIKGKRWLLLTRWWNLIGS